MPIFKVTAMCEVRATYVSYVEAQDERAADFWAGNCDDEACGKCVSVEDIGGSVEKIEPVDGVPDGYKANIAAGKDR